MCIYVLKRLEDRECLLVFYDFSADHLECMRTTSPIEPPFAVLLVTEKTGGSVSKTALLDDGIRGWIERRKRLEKTRINKFEDNFVLPAKVLYILNNELLSL